MVWLLPVILSGSINSHAVNVSVNGSPLVAAGAVETGGRVLVPIRAVLESLGARVVYQPRDHSVQASRGNQTVRIKVGERLATVGTEEMVLETPAREFGGRIFVPLRCIGEGLGADVHWDPPTKTVDIRLPAR